MRPDQVALVKASRELELAQMLENIENPSQELMTLTLDLGLDFNERKPFAIDFPFRSVFVRDASDPNSAISLKLMSDSSPYSIDLKKNDSLSLGSRMRARMYWTQQPGKTMQIVFFATSQFQSGTLNSQNAGGVSINDGATAANSNVTLAAGTAAPVVATDTNRKLAIIQNKTGGDVFFGATAAVAVTGAQEGIRVADGSTLVWRNTAQLFAISSIGGKVSIMTET